MPIVATGTLCRCWFHSRAPSVLFSAKRKSLSREGYHFPKPLSRARCEFVCNRARSYIIHKHSKSVSVGREHEGLRKCGSRDVGLFERVFFVLSLYRSNRFSRGSRTDDEYRFRRTRPRRIKRGFFDGSRSDSI